MLGRCYPHLRPPKHRRVLLAKPRTHTRASRVGASRRLRPDSDVDVLVESSLPPSGVAHFHLQEEQAALLGRKVAHHPAGSLSRYFRERVSSEAQVQYIAASKEFACNTYWMARQALTLTSCRRRGEDPDTNQLAIGGCPFGVLAGLQMMSHKIKSLSPGAQTRPRRECMLCHQPIRRVVAPTSGRDGRQNTPIYSRGSRERSRCPCIMV